MTLEVSQHLQQRLAAVVHDLKISIGQEAARAYLTRITTIKSLEFEPGIELCDDSSMKYNEDCMTDASDPSSPAVPVLRKDRRTLFADDELTDRS